jgi:hypothetical protein
VAAGRRFTGIAGEPADYEKAGAWLAIGDDVHHLHDLDRPGRALCIGGMGARSRTFCNDLACRFGYPDAARKIQDLSLAGKKKEAGAAVPEDLLVYPSLIGRL